ncbi:protein lifeguard 4-like [Dysidea avara]|uniref:protein lifeguard 4-like n=1 Tax=Dysidea avara TaxID=196820 RepID=UPI00332DA0D9
MEYSSVFNELEYKGEASVYQAEVAIRLGFLRKVYGILSVQLIFTVITCASFMVIEPLKDFVQANNVLIFVASIATFGVLFGLIFKRHESPVNFYLLGIFTLLESFTLGTIVTYSDNVVVLKAFIITMMAVVALTIYTAQSTYDYSTWGASLMSFLWILIVSGILQIFVRSEELEFVISLGGALIFCGFIIFDTHMIMHKLSPEEYILASINLYLDIINLFLYILRILEAANRK